jgi:hypothetical protein
MHGGICGQNFKDVHDTLDKTNRNHLPPGRWHRQLKNVQLTIQRQRKVWLMNDCFDDETRQKQPSTAIQTSRQSQLA